MPQAIWLPAVLIFAAASFGTLTLVFGWEGIRAWSRRRKVLRRLKPTVRSDVPRGDASLRRARSGSRLGLPGTQSIDVLLSQAHVSWSPQTYLMITLGAAAGVGGFALLITRSLLVAFLAAGAGALVPYLYLARRRKQRLTTFEAHLPDAVDLLTRAIRAGHPLSSGVKMVAEEAHPVVAREFRQVFEEQRFGLPFDDALLGLVDRNQSMDVRILVTAVLVQREVGGNLAEILDNLSETMRARFKIRRQLRVYTAQGRLSGYILGALPIVVALIILLINPDYMRLLISETIGHFMIAGAVTLQILGYLWIRKIVNIEI